ncbi:MAG: thiol oxidoreductase [Psychrobium sp.]|nr:thiol oxidoreductase [Psychrobium sp.]
MRSIQITLLCIALFLLAACGGSKQPTSPPKPVAPILDHSGLTPLSSSIFGDNEHLSGGETTVFVTNKDAFSQRPASFSSNFRDDGFFTSGDHLFRTPHAGIGPLVNAAICQGCHLNDGKGVVPSSPAQPMISMFLKIGDINGNPDPMYGDQIQTFAVRNSSTDQLLNGLPLHDGSINGDKLYGEAYAFVEYENIIGYFKDGSQYTLRKPIVKVKDLSFGPFNKQVVLSARVAPAVFGSGLLEAIPAANILALSDVDDDNNDGISGKASMVKNVLNQQMVLGRFAYKAQNPNVLQQISGAYRGDMGITNKLFIDESCTDAQLACLYHTEQEPKQGDTPDINDLQLALVEFYNKVLAVPARRGFDVTNNTWQPDIAAGRTQFFEAGCVNCHTPRHVTGDDKPSALGRLSLFELLPDPKSISYLSQQIIYPYTDLLLHDMGGSCQVTQELSDGSVCDGGEMCLYVQRCDGLADGLPQGDANGREWKTPPLWGTGLVQTVNKNATFLHDGRAQNHQQAILWHGGEAQEAKDNFVALSSEQRKQLLAFLGSL